MSPPPPTSRPGTARILLVLALLSLFPPISTDMYLSAMGDLGTYLQASPAATEMSLSLFFLGLCAGQLIVGPLIDRYGRKPPLLAGAALYVAASVGLLLVRDVNLFNALRFLQAVGACAGMVTGRAVVNDLGRGQAAARMMTVLVMLMTLGPILAPFTGSLLSVTLGWRSIFVFMVGIGVLALACTALALPETLPAGKRSRTGIVLTLPAFARLLARRDFLLPALTAALVQAAMFAFITGSAAVFQTGFGMGALAYGVLFGVVAAALVLFGHANSRLLRRFTPERILDAGLPLFLLAGVALSAVSGSDHMLAVAIPLWVAIGFVGLLTANAMSVTMEATHGAAGLGSALLGALQFGAAFLVSAAVALGSSGSALPMGLGIAVPGLLACLLWRLHRRAGPAVARA